MLSKVRGPTNDKVTEGLRKLYNELSDLYSPPNTFRAIKSRSWRRKGARAKVRCIRIDAGNMKERATWKIQAETGG